MYATLKFLTFLRRDYQNFYEEYRDLIKKNNLQNIFKFAKTLINHSVQNCV